MNSTICANAEEGTTGQLTDLRDGKTYWVTKLKDQNCWMTQNLALNLSTTEKLTSELSDVSTNGYTPPANTQVGTITKFPGSDSSSELAFSFDPGEYVYTTPDMRNSCGDFGSGIKSFSQCVSKGWQLVARLNKDSSGNEQAHYLAGNYYSWLAATAGTGSSATTSGANASGSICPKGWRLPPNSGNKSYNTLFTSYGTYQSNTLFYGTQDIRLTPLYFVYGGYIPDSSASTMLYIGDSVYYWSSTPYLSNYAYHLYFGASVDSSNTSNNNRYYGNSVRCVAK